jgi:hypothetical protein
MVLKGALNEEVVDDVVAEVAMFIAVTVEIVNIDRMECRDTQTSYMVVRSLAEPLDACRP